LRGDLDNIVLKALQKDPRRRYGSAAELADDIQRHLEHRPIKARSNTLLYRTSKFVRRHKTETIAAAVVVLVLAGAVGYSVWAEQHAAARARAELVSQRARGRRSIAVLGFKNLSTRADTAWLSIALSEMLTTELSLGGKLRTIPGESVAQTKLNLSLPELDALSQKTLSRVYKNLDSDLVVLGSYLAVADPNRTVRLDLRVQDAALGETVASMALNGSENSLPDLIARTGAELREKLGVSRISPEEAASVQASLPSNPEAARMYAEGLARLRAFDALGAKEWLSKAATADPKNPLPHSALADAMSQLGYEKAAIDESRKAFDLAANLTREQSLEIQGRYYRLTKDLGKAIQTYRALFVFFPDNVDYGLQLASSLTDAGKHQDSLKIFKALHELPPPASSDPRIDLAEAEAYSSSSLQEQERVASRAAANADALGAKWLAGRARIIQGRALKNLGQLDPAILILLRAKQLLSDVGDRLGEAKASHFLGQVYEDQGEFEEGRKALEESIRLLQSMSNRVGQTGVWNDLSTVLERENNLSQAKLALQQALTIAREYDDQNQLPVILTNMAVLETLEGDLQVAQNHLAEALAISRETADRVQTSEILNNLAPVLRAEGKSTEAGKLLEESSQISRDTGMKTALCDALIGLGDLHLDRLEPVRARRLYSEALEVSTLAKSDIYASSALSGLGEVSAAQGDLSQARKYNERALDLRMHIGDGEYLALSHMSLAELSLDEGSVSAAESMARQAINEFGAQNDVDDQAQAMAVLARSLIMQGKNAEGRQVIATAKGRAEKTADHPTRISVSIADAYSQVASGDALKAARALRAAISEARNSGYGQLQLEARLALGEALNKAGNSAAAKAELESLEHDARAKGFVFIAGKAHSARG
jgi:tetratricopeptide (TPR) repeat protein